VRFFKHLKGCQTINEQRCNCEHHVTLQSRLKWPLADYDQKPFVKIVVAIVKEGHWEKVDRSKWSDISSYIQLYRRVYFFFWNNISVFLWEKKKSSATKKHWSVFHSVLRNHIFMSNESRFSQQTNPFCDRRVL